MKPLTEGRWSRSVLILTVLGMLIALGLTVPSIDALGQEDEPVVIDRGFILLSTGPDASSNWIRYYADPVVPGAGQTFLAANPTATAQQSLSVNNRCTVSSASLNNSILDITQTGGNRVAMVSNGLGSGIKNNCATKEGRIDQTQTLSFSLDSGGFDANFFIDSFEVDVEGKFGTQLGYSLDGGEFLQAPLNNSSDNGPDSGTSDNDIAKVDPDDLFRSVTFAPTGSELAIEGGGDGPISDSTPGTVDSLREIYKVNQSLFSVVEVFEGELDCIVYVDGDPEPTGVGPTSDASTTGPATAITLWRDQNKAGACELLPYTFRINDTEVLFDAAFEQQDEATFLIKIEWDPEADVDPNTPGVQVVDPFNPPDREVDFVVDGIPNFERVTSCVALTNEGTFSSPDPDFDDLYEHPVDSNNDPVPWCLAGELLVLNSDGLWVQIQWYDGGKDPQFR